MRVLIAPDKFKGSLSAREAADEIAAGVRDVVPLAQITVLPIADGGEGTAEVICAANDGDWQVCSVQDAMGNLVTARYCTLAGKTAVMEMSQAAGLWRIPPHLRNPILASSSGAGQMLLHAASRGADEIIIGLGGSATNDGGFGLARSLGFRFLDAAGVELASAVTELARLARIVAPDRLRVPRITAAADVRNPLLGPDGATRVFGAQKGATADQMEQLEAALQRLSEIVAEELGTRFAQVAGAGAAGGLGFGLMSFCGASIRSGFEVVAERIGLPRALDDCDVAVTGEGRLDAQTLEGKAPAGLALLARKHGKRSYAIVGDAEDDVEASQLFDGISVARPPGMTRDEAIASARPLLRRAAAEAARRFAQLGRSP